MQIVDRRLNPKSKSLGNRQRFLRRAKAEIREAVKEAIKNRRVSEVDGSERVKIKSKNLREPSFSHGRGSGIRDMVLPGNEEYHAGDRIDKPQGGGGGGRGREGSPDGDGQDEFSFSLSREEFLDLFFDDLALPNMVKVKLKDIKSPKPARAGFTSDGSPARLNHVRTMRNSLGRRIALRRPSEAEIEKLEQQLAAAEADTPRDEQLIAKLRSEIEHKRRLRKTIAYIDPIDLRFNRFERVPKPTTQAVMFCLMDVSASMTENLKDLAKRFFMLLHVFLTRHYREVHIVFIRHTSQAAVVDEETFFRGTDTGGTVISSALEEMMKVVRARYSPADWNIYAAQASDGDNFHDDMPRCLELLEREILPVCQYFAYIETAHGERYSDTMETSVWSGYTEIADGHPNFAMKRVSSPDEIFPVFRDLFSRTGVAA
ncbi:MAG TPA: YeaH/YhbH family protein [Hyphomicrobiaceae bacterium]|mgnify:FL=1|nr:YeaH/YhbH family protein [Hyphomicrobiaceae bacterium]